MKILYYFKELNTPMYQWQRFHIFDELKTHDCEIEVFNPLKYKCKDEANEKLLIYIKKNKYDLFMTPHNEEDLYIETILEIKKIGIPTLLICFDSLMTPLAHKKVAKYFDLVLLSQEDRNKVFEKYECKFITSPYAANPNLFKLKKEEEILKVCFAGTPYGSRKNKINILTQNEIPVDLYASLKNNNVTINSNIDIIDNIKIAINLGRSEVGRKVILGATKSKFTKKSDLDYNNNLEIYKSVNFGEMNDIFSKYALSLSISEARNTGVLKKPINIVHLRNFEIPMSGGLQICSYFDELAQYFEEDKEILFYRSEEEFIEKAKYYLRPENEKVRNDIKLAARKRAENEHTWFCRFKKAFDYLGLDYK